MRINRISDIMDSPILCPLVFEILRFRGIHKSQPQSAAVRFVRSVLAVLKDRDSITVRFVSQINPLPSWYLELVLIIGSSFYCCSVKAVCSEFISYLSRECGFQAYLL